MPDPQTHCDRRVAPFSLVKKRYFWMSGPKNHHFLSMHVPKPAPNGHFFIKFSRVPCKMAICCLYLSCQYVMMLSYYHVNWPPPFLGQKMASPHKEFILFPNGFGRPDFSIFGGIMLLVILAFAHLVKIACPSRVFGAYLFICWNSTAL